MLAIRLFMTTSLIAVGLSSSGCRDDQVGGLLSDLSHRDAAVRRTAIKGLAEIESPSPKVTVAILGAADDTDRDVRRIALTALGRLDTPESASLLEAALDDTELSVRMASAYAVLDDTPDHEGAVAVLSEMMKMGDGGVIVRAGHERFVWAVPTLIELLRDRRPGTRRLAATSLGRIGPPAAAALPALEKARQDSDDRVRNAVAEALASIGGSAS